MHLSHLTNVEQLSLVNNPCVLSNSSWRLYLLYPSLIKCNVRLILGFVNQDYQSCIYQPQLRVSRMDFRRVSLNQKEWLTLETSPLEFVGANFHAQPSPLTVPCFYLPTNAVLLRIETTSSSIIFVQPSLMWYGVAYCFNIYINVQFQQRWRGEGRGVAKAEVFLFQESMELSRNSGKVKRWKLKKTSCGEGLNILWIHTVVSECWIYISLDSDQWNKLQTLSCVLLS